MKWLRLAGAGGCNAKEKKTHSNDEQFEELLTAVHFNVSLELAEEEEEGATT